MAIIIDINHEDGTLDEYTTTVVDGGDLSVLDSAALANTNYGLSGVINDAVIIYGQSDLGTPSTTGYVRARIYFDPNTISASSNFWILRLFNSSSITITGLGFINPLQIQGSYLHDTGTAYVGTTEITDEPHYIELFCMCASTPTSSDGVFQFWIDGVSKYSNTNIDNYDSFINFDHVRMGFLSAAAGVSGSLFWDELIVRDDDIEIGPLALDEISGTLAITLANVTNTSQGVVDVTGSLSKTLNNVDLVSTAFIELTLTAEQIGSVIRLEWS